MTYIMPVYAHSDILTAKQNKSSAVKTKVAVSKLLSLELQLTPMLTLILTLNSADSDETKKHKTHRQHLLHMSE